MLLTRVITAAVGVPIIIGLILLGGALFTAAVAVILLVAAMEFFAATDPEGRSRVFEMRLAGVVGFAAVCGLVIAADAGADEWTGLLAISIAAVFFALVLTAGSETSLRDWLWATGGIVYVGFLGSHLVLLRDLSEGREWVLLAVFATFATDTAAYFAGKAFGRVHITPRISPGKTLEGSIGGYAAGFAAVLALKWVTGLEVGAEIALLALLLPAVAMLGDLAESMIKRGAGVKDAGSLVPGHGGLLDRLDSILFTAPLVYYFVIWTVY